MAHIGDLVRRLQDAIPGERPVNVLGSSSEGESIRSYMFFCNGCDSKIVECDDDEVKKYRITAGQPESDVWIVETTNAEILELGCKLEQFTHGFALICKDCGEKLTRQILFGDQDIVQRTYFILTALVLNCHRVMRMPRPNF